MIGLLLTVMRLVGSPLHAVTRWALANPLAVLCIGLGLYGLWEHHRAAGWQRRAQACQMASDAARKAQDALRAQEAKDYHDKAAMADAEHAANLDRVRAAVRTYSASHRVQALRASTAQPVSAPSAAGVSERVPADPFVAISDTDMQKCSDTAAYAVGAFNFGQSISAPPEVVGPKP